MSIFDRLLYSNGLDLKPKGRLISLAIGMFCWLVATAVPTLVILLPFFGLLVCGKYGLTEAGIHTAFKEVLADAGPLYAALLFIDLCSHMALFAGYFESRRGEKTSDVILYAILGRRFPIPGMPRVLILRK